MAKSKEHQFDISAKLDMQEMKNAVVQTQKEVDNRYDFKGIEKDIDLNQGAKTLTLTSGSDNKIDAIKDVLDQSTGYFAWDCQSKVNAPTSLSEWREGSPEGWE